MAKGTTNGNGSVSIDDLSDQINVLKNDIATLTSAVGEYGKAKSHAASQQAREKMHEFSEASRARATEAQAQAEEFIREQPATALGVAAGLGFLVGLLMARR